MNINELIKQRQQAIAAQEALSRQQAIAEKEDAARRYKETGNGVLRSLFDRRRVEQVRALGIDEILQAISTEVTGFTWNFKTTITRTQLETREAVVSWGRIKEIVPEGLGSYDLDRYGPTKTVTVPIERPATFSFDSAAKCLEWLDGRAELSDLTPEEEKVRVVIMRERLDLAKLRFSDVKPSVFKYVACWNSWDRNDWAGMGHGHTEFNISLPDAHTVLVNGARSTTLSGNDITQHSLEAAIAEAFVSPYKVKKFKSIK